jgi:hypothetical protein
MFLFYIASGFTRDVLFNQGTGAGDAAARLATVGRNL